MRNQIWTTILLTATLGASWALAEDRNFAVRDSIEMARFSILTNPDEGRLVAGSPDGRMLAVVTTRGDIETNQLESTIWIFDARAIEQFLQAPPCSPAPKPRALARIAAVPEVRVVTPYASVVTNLDWSADSQAIFFLGERDDRGRGLYRADVRTGTLTSLSPAGYDVRRFDVAGSTVVFSTWPAESTEKSVGPMFGDVINADVRAVTGLPISDILFPQNSIVPKVSQLWCDRDGRLHQLRDPNEKTPEKDLNYLPEVLTISPDRTIAIVLKPVSVMPASWNRFRPAPGADGAALNAQDPRTASPYVLRRLRQYAVVDLATGKTVPLLDSPFADSFGYLGDSRAMWSRDGRRVLLTNTFLPQNGEEPADPSGRFGPCAIAAVDWPSRTARCVVADLVSGHDWTSHAEPPSLEELGFGSSDNDVFIQAGPYRKCGRIVRFHDTASGWTRVSFNRDSEDPHDCRGSSAPEDELANGLEVEVRQGLNTPPALWATDGRTGQSRELWDPNPQLRHLQFGPVSVFHWKDKSGYEWTAGLVKPVNFVPGKRYPLVIQTHGFSEDDFMTDGMNTTAEAALALASAGIVVLQVKDKPTHSMDASEAEGYVEGYGRAVDELAAEGLIDPSKVGLVGFSWTCWYVETALIHDPGRYRAATIADGLDNSYLQYHLWGAGSPAIEKQAELINDGKPIAGEGLANWIDAAPGFHLDKVRTPLRIEAIGPMSVLGEWEIYSSLEQQGKPVDLIYNPNGQHILQKPLDRLASQQGNVDWFRFWLQGWEDPTPETSSQYERWRRLRMECTPAAQDDK
jgi:dipeptidyl aminopeptidase/acylaminoacyl peptidase